MSGTGLRGFIDFLRLTASQYLPGMGGSIDEASAEYNRRQDAVAKARQDLLRAQTMRPFEQFRQRTEQRTAETAETAAGDRLAVAQGRATPFEAAGRALIAATKQLEDTRRTFGADDPRTLTARASALDAFTAYDSEVTRARRFRNDPTIVADSLARLGGGGGVGVFGDGRGELLFEQKRLNTSIASLTKAMQTLTVALSRTNVGGDVE
jgi:hypothetical protein